MRVHVSVSTNRQQDRLGWAKGPNESGLWNVTPMKHLLPETFYMSIRGQIQVKGHVRIPQR